MATQKETEKQSEGGRKQKGLTRQSEPQSAQPVPTARRIAPAGPMSTMSAMSPMSMMRRMLDDLDAGSFGWGWPTSMMRQMLDDMEGMFEPDIFVEPRTREYVWAPRIEVRQRDNKLVICADLPGISQDSVAISAQDNALVIEGDRPRPEEEGERWQSERPYGHFRRVVALPAGVDADQAEARFDNGVLEISVPLPASHVERKIAIRGGESRDETASATAQGPSTPGGDRPAEAR